MDDQVRTISPAVIQDPLIVGEEILSSPAALDPGLDRQVESQVRVSKKQDLDRFRHSTIIAHMF
jgi:hypothetical protein